ncbi:MAG: hypothetical protein HYS17_11040 [Micavibrio aeruginosavorus]|uniref:Uncharacterized protein n=1 Tax=Micavibrio aeruginosavorus TaxID=349221 RepID=A0A7T5UG97_9BACT|nr:MAG: hypothetical protein HYS17_11040 [Micavibrio aeruginosavorus]
MTYQGMHRESVSRSDQTYILIPNSVNKLPERIEAAQALRLVNNASIDDDLALFKVSERIQGDPQLESQVRGFWITSKGLLLHGTMDAAFRLTHAYDVQDTPEAMSAPSLLGSIRSSFKGSMEYYTGCVRREIESISQMFDGFAGHVPAAVPSSFAPRMALAA